jgi:hypothetical protein
MSETKPINIKFKWDKDTLLNSFEAIYLDEYKNSPKRLMGWIFIAMAQFGVVAALKKSSFGLLIFSTIMLVYWYYGKKYIAKKRAVKAFENDPLKDKDISIKADKEGKSLENQFWRWEDIESVADVENGFLLIKEPKHYFIPSKGFKSFEDKSRFKSFFKSTISPTN